MNLYVFDIIEKVLSYYAILSAIQNHSSNRIQNSKNVVVVEDRRSISILENRKTLHSSCLVKCSHFESLHRNKSLRTLSIRMCAQIVVISCLILCSSRTIRSRKTRFLLIFWKIWFFESQMIRFACWKWFNKSETSSKKRTRSTMNNAI